MSAEKDADTHGHGEEILYPDLLICDAHHHLWRLPDQRYLIEEFLGDAQSGHAVDSTIYVEAGAFYSPAVRPEFRPVGETEFAVGVAAMAASGDYGPTRVATGIVAFADLAIGARIGEVVAAHCAAGRGRVRGVRQSGAWDSDPRIVGGRLHAPQGLYRQPGFREGLAQLTQFGLAFDAFVNHPQLPDVVDLARAFPDQTIILDHTGGLLGVGPYAGQHDSIFAGWRSAIRELAACPNVLIKLGGLGTTRCGFGFHRLQPPASSQVLADAWRPWIETCIEAFGAGRCMFESNFPVDRRSSSYAVLWNAFKRLCAGVSSQERESLFRETALAAYRIPAASGAIGS